MVGKIYAIRSEETEFFYIGSTLNDLNTRLSQHKTDYKRYNEGRFNYISSYEIVKYHDADIYLLEEVEADNKQDLERHEGLYLQNLPDNERLLCINKNIAGNFKRFASMDEYQRYYYETKREIIRERQRRYYETNRLIFKMKRLNKKK